MAIITISRGTFSGGKALAEALSKRLGYPCVSREEVFSLAVKEYDIPEEELISVINRPPPFWVQVPSKRIAFLKCVTSVILDHEKGGNLIYHGHAGHLLLSDIPHLIRIRLIADMAFRLKAAKELHNIEGDEAVAYIEKTDNERNKWARFFYGIELGDPNLYDAVFNLQRNTIDDVCELVVRMTEFEQHKTTEASLKALYDFKLASRVWANIAKDKHTRSAPVNVFADNGTVSITGNVGSEKTVEAVTQVASLVKGVMKVNNNIGIGGDLYW
ncbi:MAG: cytidylate kinase family protein [Deltaproteobacteria bacterium]|nr:cytidylate kinase family protein [Deltaproteobacteria bacterium]